MSNVITLDIEKRDENLNPRQLRSEGKVPATVYGADFEATSIQLDSKKFQTVYSLNPNSLYELKNGKSLWKAIVKDAQINATTNELLNIEFQKVVEDKKVRLKAPLVPFGVSEAVKMGASLRLPITELLVECLPKDIPSEIKFDISPLVSFDDRLTVQDIQYPEGVSPVSANVVVAKVKVPRGSK
ncbi:MAG: 50S ribosomal protein L25 [Candidatus Gastranaerophilales bacterium]|nr:50S ribosomal protein L25 [Candidatus Gastranaerophilales bacterium]